MNYPSPDQLIKMPQGSSLPPPALTPLSVLERGKLHQFFLPPPSSGPLKRESSSSGWQSGVTLSQ